MESTEKIILDTSGYVNPLLAAMEVTKKAGEQFEDFEKTIINSQKKSGKAVVDASEKVDAAIIQNVSELRKQRIELSNNVKNFEILGISYAKIEGLLKTNVALFNNYRKAIGLTTKITETQAAGVERLTKTLGGGKNAFIAMARTVNILKGALLASGIGLFVVALGSLVAFLTKSQKGMDLMSRKLASLGAVADQVIDVFSDLGGSIVESFDQGTALEDFVNLLKNQVVNRITAIGGLFKELGSIISNTWEGNFDGVKEDFAEIALLTAQFVTGIEGADIAEFANGVSEAASAADILEGKFQSIARSARELEVRTAQSRAEIKRLNKDAEDVTLTFEERGKAAAAAYAIEQSLVSQRIDNQEELVNAIKEQNALSNSTDADLQKQYDAEIELANLKAESLEQQTTIQNKLNAIRSSEVADLKKQAEAIQKGVEATFAALSQADFKQFDLIKSEQIEKLKEFKKIISEVGQRTDFDTSGFSNSLDDVIGKLENFADEKPAEIGSTAGKRFAEGFKIAVREIKAPELDFQETFLDQMAKMWDSIANDPRFQGAATFVNELGGLLTSSLNTQLEANQALIDQRQEQIESLEDDLEKEQEYYESGLANSLNSKQEEYNTLLVEQEKFQAEQQKLREQAAQAQLIQDSIQQGSSLVTASIKIIEGFSKIPFVGLPLGIAAVGTLLGFFAKTKIDAAKATKLSGGADRIDDHFGYINPTGPTDKGHGKGYKIIHGESGRDTGVVISGREMLLTEDVSNKYKSIIEGMNAGNIHTFDIGSLTDRKGSIAPSVTINQQQSQQNGKQFVTFVTKNGKQGAIVRDAAKFNEGDVIYFE